jgi:hypothetical protein
VVTQEGKGTLGRRRCRWVDNIKEKYGKTERGSMDWADMAHCRDHWRPLVNTVMGLRVPQNARKFLRSCTIGCLSRRALFMELVVEEFRRLHCRQPYILALVRTNECF